MADLTFKEAEARMWEKSVRQELANCNQVLARVDSDCACDPAEDDDILVAVQKAGKGMEDAWNKMKKTFEDASDSLEKVIDDYAKAVAKGVDAVKDFMKNFRI